MISHTILVTIGTGLCVAISLGFWFVKCIDFAELQRSEDAANDLI